MTKQDFMDKLNALIQGTNVRMDNVVEFRNAVLEDYDALANLTDAHTALTTEHEALKTTNADLQQRMFKLFMQSEMFKDDKPTAQTTTQTTEPDTEPVNTSLSLDELLNSLEGKE